MGERAAKEHFDRLGEKLIVDRHAAHSSELKLLIHAPVDGVPSFDNLGGDTGSSTSPRCGQVGCAAAGRGAAHGCTEISLPVLAGGSNRLPPNGER